MINKKLNPLSQCAELVMELKIHCKTQSRNNGGGLDELQPTAHLSLWTAAQ